MAQTRASRGELLRVLGPVSATTVVVGSVIGSGIFYKANVISASVGRFDLVLLVWIVCGVMSLLGALALAELAAMMPHAGGQYVYLREAYGPLTGFLWGWGEFWIMRTASCAALAVAFAKAFFQAVYPVLHSNGTAQVELRGDVSWLVFSADTAIQVVWIERSIAIAAVIGLTFVNVAGSRWGGLTQNVTTFAKMGVLALLMVLPFITGQFDPGNLATTYAPATKLGLWAGFGAAMTASFWAYDGWNNIGMVAEEVHHPQRNIPLALIVGMLILIVLYVGVSVAYHLVLPMQELAEIDESTFAAARVCSRLLGPYGAAAASAAVMVSTFGALNSNILTGPRVIFAMARDRLFPAAVAHVHPVYRTPDIAIIAESVWAVLLILGSDLLTRVPVPSGLESLPVWLADPLRQSISGMRTKAIFDVLTDFVIFGQFVFYLLSAAAVFVLRAKRPDAERPYRTMGYPWLPAIFVVGSTGFLCGMLVTSPVESAAGLGFIALGLLAYQLRPRGVPAT